MFISKVIPLLINGATPIKSFRGVISRVISPAITCYN